jgi:hypothetical protein
MLTEHSNQSINEPLARGKGEVMFTEITSEGEELLAREDNEMLVIHRDWVMIDRGYGGEVTWIPRDRVERVVLY